MKSYMHKLIQWFNIELDTLVYKILLIFLFSNCTLYAKNELIESQPEILFQYDKLKKTQDNLALQVEFNKAVLFLGKGEYKKAIDILKKTALIIKVPSNLNIGIAYYKLGAIDKAIVYLNDIYKNKAVALSDTYSYMSACYYLYQISKDNKYLDTIVKISRKYKNLTEHSKRMLADTYIILKEYKSALKILNSMNYAMDLKKALLYIKLKDYEKANILLEKSQNNTLNPSRLNQILWFRVFVDLKSNNIERLRENLDLIQEKKSLFKANQDLPLEIFFNENKYSSKDYLDFVSKFDDNRKYNFLFYFAPFIFSDSEEIIYDSSKGFIFNSEGNLNSLEEMVEYNNKFLDIIKEDPIIRVVKLKKLLSTDTKSYIYYNLALSYTHIQDYFNAHKYFIKAFKLNPGNKLYAVMTLLTANKLGKKLADEEYINAIIRSKDGIYNYFGKKIYTLFFNPEYKLEIKPLSYKSTIFYKALDYLEKLNNNEPLNNHPLLSKYFKDPLTYLMRLVQREKNESNYSYFSRLQDSVPLSLNNNFLEGPLIITKYYIDVLKAIGLMKKADLTIVGKNSPSYLRTKALSDLHLGRPDETIKTIEYLQKEYKLEDKYTMYLLVAALLEAGRYNDASIQISLIKAILNDKDADFLTAVQLIQELKISSAKQYITQAYKDALIDFKLIGFDEYLESL